MLGLSLKYLADTICDPLIATLSSDWPTTLVGWDRIEADIEVSIKYGPFGRAYIDRELPEPCSMIALARKFPVLNPLLPSAFYHLSRIPRWADSRLGDPNISNDPSVSEEEILKHASHLAEGGRSAQYSLLAVEDLLRLEKVDKEIGRIFSAICDHSLLQASIHCEFHGAKKKRQIRCRDRCSAAMQDVCEEVEKEYQRTRDPLRVMCGEGDIRKPRDACANCPEHFRLELIRLRERLWDEWCEFVNK